MKLFLDINLAKSKKIFLTGVARSGTTWLQELVNYNNKYRVIFEPFQPASVKRLADKFAFRYVREADERPVEHNIMSRLLGGKFRRRCMDSKNRKRLTVHRLFKSVRSSLMLAWLKAEFPEVIQVFIIRNCLSVVNSQFKAGWKKGNSLRLYLEQQSLMEDHLEPFREIMEEAEKDDFERHVVDWCVCNYVPLKQFDPNGFFLVQYERLVAKPESVLPDLMSFLREPYSPEIMKGRSKKSRMTKKASMGKRRADFLNIPVQSFSAKQVAFAHKTFELFRFDELYEKWGGSFYG